MASGSWTDDEIGATVDVYFQMLILELAGETYTKSEFWREVRATRGALVVGDRVQVQQRLWVLDEMGAVWIPRYKPLRNVQDRLRTLVRDRFESDTDLRAFKLKAVADIDVETSALGVEVDPSGVDWPERPGTRVGVVDINFAAIESSNRALGRAGEFSVVEAERARLIAAGRDDLAAEVRHVSVLKGDGLGYDIQSFQGLTRSRV